MITINRIIYSLELKNERYGILRELSREIFYAQWKVLLIEYRYNDLSMVITFCSYSGMMMKKWNRKICL